MENNIINNNINEKPKNEFIFNFIKNLNDIKTKSLEIKNNNYDNNINQNLLKEKDKKIEDLQKQCEELKKQLEIKNNCKNKKEEQNNIYKNINKNNYDNSTFNTSTNFPGKNEIKKIWEELALVSILDTFIDFESEPEKIYNLICEMILIMDKLINDLCREIYEKVSLSLNIPTNDKKFINDIEKVSRPLIKEHLNKIFIDTENKPFIDKFIYLYQNKLENNNILNFNKKDNEIIEQIIQSEEFIQMIKKIKDILLYTKFNDQQLFFKIEPDIKKRNIERIIINNINDKKNYLIINDNNLINYPAIVIINPPVMKNGFPLNNDFKPILMIINENNFSNNHLKTNIIEHNYQIYANSFTIFDNNMMNNNKNENKIYNIFKEKNISLPATRNNENKDKNKFKLKLEIKNSLPFLNKNELESEITKRSSKENYENINYFNINNNNNTILNKKAMYNYSNNDNINYSNTNNINSTFIKDHSPYILDNYIKNNTNSFISNPQKQELFYDSLLQSEYINSPKNISDNSSIHEKEKDIVISINSNEIKRLQSLNINNNLNSDNNNLYKNNNNKRKSLNNNNNNNNNYKHLSQSRRNIDQKKIKKNTNNRSDKNICKNIFNNEKIKYGRQNDIKYICSTEIANYNNYYNNNNENIYLKKYKTVKEMSKGKNTKNNDKYFFSLNNYQIQNISTQKNLNKDNDLKYLNNSKKDTEIFKEYLKTKKKKQNINITCNNINNNINKNYINHKFEKNSSYKNKLNNLYNNECKSIHREKNKKHVNYSPLNSNSNNRNYNRKNKQIEKREQSYNNTNIQRRSKKSNTNSSYNSNYINGNYKVQQEISSTSSILKNNTINTGFKIKNVNINYFNIMQPNELFFNQQKTNRSKSKSNISNISNKKPKKNYNLKTNKYLDINKSKNDNSLFLMTDLLDIKKNKDNKRKDKKRIISKLPETHKYNDSCLSEDVKRPKMITNEQKKIRITKQSIRLNDAYVINSFDKNKNYAPKNNNFIHNFYNSNNKQMSFIKIPNKTSNNSSKQKNVNNRIKIIDKLQDNHNCREDKNFHKSHYINLQNKKNNDYDNYNLLDKTFLNNRNNNITNVNNQKYLLNNNIINQSDLINYNYARK